MSWIAFASYMNSPLEGGRRLRFSWGGHCSNIWRQQWFLFYFI